MGYIPNQRPVLILNDKHSKSLLPSLEMQVFIDYMLPMLKVSSQQNVNLAILMGQILPPWAMGKLGVNFITAGPMAVKQEATGRHSENRIPPYTSLGDNYSVTAD